MPIVNEIPYNEVTCSINFLKAANSHLQPHFSAFVPAVCVVSRNQAFGEASRVWAHTTAPLEKLAQHRTTAAGPRTGCCAQEETLTKESRAFFMQKHEWLFSGRSATELQQQLFLRHRCSTSEKGEYYFFSLFEFFQKDSFFFWQKRERVGIFGFRLFFESARKPLMHARIILFPCLLSRREGRRQCESRGHADTFYF